MRNQHKGFTLIELMIVVAIIGILSMFALPAYQDYTKRTYVTEGMALASSAKLAITETFSATGAWPQSNEEAGLSSGDRITGQSVAGIWITPGANEGGLDASAFSTIAIYYNDKVIKHSDGVPQSQPNTFPTSGNNILTLVPFSIKTDVFSGPNATAELGIGSIQWQCFARSSELELKWLPNFCRAQTENMDEI